MTASDDIPINTAAWINWPGERFIVKDAPYTEPEANEVVIQVRCVAINPLDRNIQDEHPLIRVPIKYPTILGGDASGVVVQKGTSVESFNVGDRVSAHLYGFLVEKPHKSAFQKYTVVEQTSLIALPEDVSFEAGSVLPLSCDTAMTGLYVPEFLGLELPSLHPQSKDQILLVWGGSSSVGCSVIQMARASGYKVAVVASARNHPLCSMLGATACFDQADEDIVSTIVKTLKDEHFAGAYDCIADPERTMRPCAEILKQCKGVKKLMAVLDPPSENFVEGVLTQRVFIPKMLGTSTSDRVHMWLAESLTHKQFVPKPDPLIVGHGLESIQLGVDTLRKGVSAAKVVVPL